MINTTKPDYKQWGRQRAFWTTEQVAYLFLDREPDTGPFDHDLKNMLETIRGWLVAKLGYALNNRHNEDTPQEYIELADCYDFAVPNQLREAVKSRPKTNPPKSVAVKVPKKQNRENALHTELKQLFIGWGKPATNKECWDNLRKVDFDGRDNTVIQEVVHNLNRDECKILWQERGKERIMSRATFDNVMGRFRK